MSMEFGDYCLIEQKRFGIPNEMYLHKVIGHLRSTAWVDVPVKVSRMETNHKEMVDVIACVCCGIDEREILRYRESDCRPSHQPSEARVSP
jgi:hypothetical protein